MTRGEFEKQMDRLAVRFGAKHFDPEFKELVAREVQKLTDSEIKWICDTFIGSRSAHKAPLLSEFKEARFAIEKRKLAEAAAQGAARILAHPKASADLKQVLKREFGVESIADAIELKRFQRRIGESDGNGPEGAA